MTSRRIQMTLLILLVRRTTKAQADSHSLRYYYTGVSSPGFGLHVYSSVGYVDDREIVNYNSDTRQYRPKVEWMKKLGDDYWESGTERGRGKETLSKENVQIMMDRFNQTAGLHVLQRMQGCELRDDGSTAGYDQYGYDGRDLLYLDTQSWIYIPTMNEAQITAQKWNSPEFTEGKILKNYLEEECIDWLKTFINNGREDLERRVRPEVKVWGHQSEGETKLHCLVYGFHPRSVDVKWVRNDVDEVLSLEAKTILPHPDGTYQLRVTVEVPTREEDSYSCHVDHSSLEEILKVKWDPRNDHQSNVIVIVVAVIIVIAVLAAAIAGVTVFRRKRRKKPTDYQATSTSENNSDDSNNSTA